MKLKYHKIAKVDKTICTFEQKIAYELAFQTHINYGTEKEYKAQTVEIYRKEIVFDFIAKCLRSFKNALEVDKKLNKFNIDAIQAALNAGAENYLKGENFVLWNYEEVGKMFPANYL